ncbi:thiamine diphosphate-binding protein [Tuber brumale]|nr:thiamine diphosphate-binding protein [Tuber brumale]
MVLLASLRASAPAWARVSRTRLPPPNTARCFASSIIARQNAPMKQPPHSDSVLFPGAVNSKFTNELKFQRPQDLPAIPTYRLIDNHGQVVDISREPDISQELALKMYKDMVTTSIMDLLMYESQRQGRISFYMVSAGEEGIAVGSAAALAPDDVIFSQYREQGVMMYRGFTLDEFMNQLFANKFDYGKGRNMPIHYMSERLHMHPISSPLATQIPHSVGAAYALKLDQSSRIVVCFFGEGAASEGDFHAALNIAATRSCPVVFICRNNGFAISTPTLEQYKGDGIASRGVGYGIDTIRVDGNDIMGVREVTMRARDIALKEQKPVLIEAMSYRVSHHSTSDDSFAYRAKVEVEDWKRRDNPITRMRKWLESKSWWSGEQDQELRTQVRKDILKAFARAEKEKKPALENLFLDIFKIPSRDLEEQMAELRRIIEEYPDEYDLEAFDRGKEGL